MNIIGLNYRHVTTEVINFFVAELLWGQKDLQYDVSPQECRCIHLLQLFFFEEISRAACTKTPSSSLLERYFV